MAKVLFLGVNDNQIPYLKAAQSLGFEVVGTDLNPNAPGAVLCDRFYPVGYTDVDNLLEVANSEGFGNDDHVFTAAAHFAWEGLAYVADRLGIAQLTPETVDSCLDKNKFYQVLGKLGVPVPPTTVLRKGDMPDLDPDKIYYLKSDYGKTPRYCYRVTGGQLPERPAEFDRFYRRCFLLQEEITGVHFRVNMYADQTAVFLKFTDLCSTPLAFMGPGHGDVVAALQRVGVELGLEKVLTKFDLIVNDTGWYVIDLGLDPPMRLRLLCQYRDIDFPHAYMRGYLCDDWTGLPAWERIAGPPLLIEGILQEGVRFTPLGGRQ